MQNDQACPKNTGAPTELERTAFPESLAAASREETGNKRVHISFVSVRKRMCDPDNISVKGALDLLRYCQIIAGDEPDKITLEICQRKAAPNEEEHTQIEIYYP